ncbi:MAG TPA: hypothetical protein VG166_07110, partial [Caulobacteraceae bacterium]|nr:hypothetical protein [Caulobacteraceae bacterium]
MKQLCIGLALAAGMTTTALAAADPLTAPIHQFIDAFDKGDTKTAAGAYAVGGVTIIDEVPPHLWQGPKGFESWAADLMKDAKAHGDTNAGVTLGNVARQEVTGSRAYVVFP